MKFLEVSINTSALGTEVVSGALFALGITQVSIVDTRIEAERFLGETAKNWDYADIDEMNLCDEAKVVCYLADTDENNAAQSLAKIETAVNATREYCDIDMGSLSLSFRERDDSDWVNEWKKYYKPVSIGEKLLVVPIWEKPPATTRKLISIDPGLAFGTGLHPTTRMCAELMEGAVSLGSRAIDLGCGSGILSVAAKFLGAQHVCAIDIDENAVIATRKNIRLNSLDDSDFDVLHGDVLNDKAFFDSLGSKSFDVAVANIVASVIVPLAPIAHALLTDSGYFIASGIIADKLKEVLAALEDSGLTIKKILREGEWAACLTQKES